MSHELVNQVVWDSQAILLASLSQERDEEWVPLAGQCVAIKFTRALAIVIVSVRDCWLLKRQAEAKPTQQIWGKSGASFEMT
tara:strand:+ start:76 stop:321 length:246 start_codon:yes stop_codon:yes gene_type:complete